MRAGRILLVALTLGLAVSTLHAQPRRISPGKLSSAHSDLEGIDNCTKCHELGKGVSQQRCLDCHVSIADRIEREVGLHASEEHQGKRCAKCHSEHHGREFELVYWEKGETSFDHTVTGYKLQGAHAEAKCEQCHRPEFVRDPIVLKDENVAMDRTRLGLSQSCVACHNDEHADQVSDDCLTCHTFENWSPASGFDHAESPYPLTGKHTDVSCEKCHPLKPASPSFEGALMKSERVGQRYAYKLPGRYPNCTPCHTDPHEGRYKKSCEECHRTVGWSTLAEGSEFDHDMTAYPLRGRHKVVDCGTCHKTEKRTDPLAHDHCTDCHADEHRGQFADREQGVSCEPCHVVEGFVPANFTLEQHQTTTRYRLEGSHLAIPCILCHVQVEDGSGDTYERFTFEDRTCQGCHDDPHGGRLNRWIEEGGCELCHNVQTWHRTSFDHTRTEWELIGKHREVGCLQCHKEVDPGTGEPKIWFKPQSTACASCHMDEHRGQFLVAGAEETACERCHVTAGWKRPDLNFDHDKDSEFILRGAHANVECVKCHIEESDQKGEFFVRYKPVDERCVACHLPKFLEKTEFGYRQRRELPQK